MTDLQLFPDPGVTRPPGVPETARPDDGTAHQCPRCTQRTLHWVRLTYAYCEWAHCGYVWTRSGQLHHSESLPI